MSNYWADYICKLVNVSVRHTTIHMFLYVGGKLYLLV